MVMTSGVYAQTQNRRGGEFYVGQPRQVDIEKKIDLLNEQIEQKKDDLKELDREFIFWSRSNSHERSKSTKNLFAGLSSKTGSL